VASILTCKRCKFGEKICYNARDIEFFLGDYFFWRALYTPDGHADAWEDNVWCVTRAAAGITPWMAPCKVVLFFVNISSTGGKMAEKYHEWWNWSHVFLSQWNERFLTCQLCTFLCTTFRQQLVIFGLRTGRRQFFGGRELSFCVLRPSLTMGGLGVRNCTELLLGLCLKELAERGYRWCSLKRTETSMTDESDFSLAQWQ